jgi:outer membrane protein OmpA-like peptidoglycan-associated protein
MLLAGPSASGNSAENGRTPEAAYRAPPVVRGLVTQESGAADLLTFARGVLFVAQTGLASGSGSAALLAIDGDPYRLALTTDAAGPVEFVYKLPATTTFERFGVPAVVEQPGNVTFVKSVTVSGSMDGPDSGFQELAAFELETHGPDESVTELDAQVSVPVRWVKVRFEGGINIEPGDEGRTAIWFSEIMGYGTQEARELALAFDGEWDLRLTERTDLRGIPLELTQDGATIFGCYGDHRLSGSVNGAIARATGEDPQGRTGALILVADEDGSIHASVSVNRGRFGARTAVTVPELAPTECAEIAEEPVVCGTNVYINFDVNSAAIRPESEQVLADVFRRLTEEGATAVSIRGHTSTEGTAEHNLDLSQRRAQAVVDDFVERGFEPAAISAEGLGESQPLISPDSNESAREINRRVEISCG